MVTVLSVLLQSNWWQCWRPTSIPAQVGLMEVGWKRALRAGTAVVRGKVKGMKETKGSISSIPAPSYPNCPSSLLLTLHVLDSETAGVELRRPMAAMEAFFQEHPYGCCPSHPTPPTDTHC